MLTDDAERAEQVARELDAAQPRPPRDRAADPVRRRCRLRGPAARGRARGGRARGGTRAWWASWPPGWWSATAGPAWSSRSDGDTRPGLGPQHRPLRPARRPRRRGGAPDRASAATGWRPGWRSRPTASSDFRAALAAHAGERLAPGRPDARRAGRRRRARRRAHAGPGRGAGAPGPFGAGNPAPRPAGARRADRARDRHGRGAQARPLLAGRRRGAGAWGGVPHARSARWPRRAPAPGRGGGPRAQPLERAVEPRVVLCSLCPATRAVSSRELARPAVLGRPRVRAGRRSRAVVASRRAALARRAVVRDRRGEGFAGVAGDLLTSGEPVLVVVADVSAAVALAREPGGRDRPRWTRRGVVVRPRRGPGVGRAYRHLLALDPPPAQGAPCSARPGGGLRAPGVGRCRVRLHGGLLALAAGRAAGARRVLAGAPTAGRSRARRSRRRCEAPAHTPARARWGAVCCGCWSRSGLVATTRRGLPGLTGGAARTSSASPPTAPTRGRLAPAERYLSRAAETVAEPLHRQGGQSRAAGLHPSPACRPRSTLPWRRCPGRARRARDGSPRARANGERRASPSPAPPRRKAAAAVAEPDFERRHGRPGDTAHAPAGPGPRSPTTSGSCSAICSRWSRSTPPRPPRTIDRELVQQRLRVRVRAPRRPAPRVGRGLHRAPGRRGQDLRGHAPRHGHAVRRAAARHRRGHQRLARGGAARVRRRGRPRWWTGSPSSPASPSRAATTARPRTTAR